MFDFCYWFPDVLGLKTFYSLGYFSLSRKINLVKLRIMSLKWGFNLFDTFHIIRRGAVGVTVSVVGSGLGYSRSNPEWGCLYFT